MSKRKKAYLRYLESEHWKLLRRQAFERDGFRCCMCGTGKQLQGHHVRYRKDLERCTVKDVMTLCKACHERHHREKARTRREMRKIRNEKRGQQVSHLTYLLLTFSAKP